MSSTVRACGATAIVAGFIGYAVGKRDEGRTYRLNAATALVVDREPTAVAPITSPATGDSSLVRPWNKSQRVSEIMRHGYPSLDTVRTYDNFVLSYDRRNRTANWVLEHLSPELLSAGKTGSDGTSKSLVNRSYSSFFEDKSMHPYFRSSNEDYLRSGFDRGHLAAAGNHKVTQSLMDQTFVLSNISPQVGKGFNRDVWNDLEQYVRYRAKKARNLWVCTGPLYLPRNDLTDGRTYVKYQVIGKNNVAVPTHFFKALLVENTDGSVDLESYVMENKPLDPNIPLRAYQVPLDSIERSAGFLLFHEVPKNVISRMNGDNVFLQKFQNSLEDDRRQRIASRSHA